MPHLRDALCWVFGHQYHTRRVFSSDSRKIGCYRCGRAWAMNDRVRLLVDWDADCEAMYRVLGLWPGQFLHSDEAREEAPAAVATHGCAFEEDNMETMTQPKITGYRQLSEGEVALMNEGKALAEQVGAYVEKLRGMNGISATEVPNPALDQRWVSLGATQLQQGFMALTRGIAQPTTF